MRQKSRPRFMQPRPEPSWKVKAREEVMARRKERAAPIRNLLATLPKLDLD